MTTNETTTWDEQPGILVTADQLGGSWRKLPSRGAAVAWLRENYDEYELESEVAAEWLAASEATDGGLSDTIQPWELVDE